MLEYFQEESLKIFKGKSLKGFIGDKFPKIAGEERNWISPVAVSVGISWGISWRVEW